MATSLRLMHGAYRLLGSTGKRAFSVSSMRYLLSETYSCNEAWKKYLQDPTLNQISLDGFSHQIYEQLEKNRGVSGVDINVLAHQFHKMEEEDVEYIVDILARFNLCHSNYPRNDSTSHAIARGFLDTNSGEDLINLLSDRLTYGIYPNHYTLNLIMDFFIKQGDFHKAAKVSYCSMIQEDFSNPINTLLSLQSSVQHLLTSNIDDLAPPPKEQSEGEENWIKVDYIQFPYYDDHFDIKDERFLLGKTLLMLGKVQSIGLPKDLRNSLQIIGCGLYHKFGKGVTLLKDILGSSDGSISQKALDYFSESLEKVEARDPNEPEVELALRTIDDVIHRILPTTDEKAEYQVEFLKLKEELSSQGKIQTDFDLGKTVTEFVTTHVSQYEEPDISSQTKLFNVWIEARNNELNEQMAEIRKKARIEEMKKQLVELEKQEELLTYFDFEEKIRLHFVDEDRATDPNLTISK
uniref:28S ribosomal protein S27, mitochondrial n=1 Tax=Arion vulgaris TaxID=1028688 RepID=A0A0B7AY37_9EUPU